MDFVKGNIYHIYNRGNNKQMIFFNDGNYIYFLQKIRKYIIPHCHILAYVLMPNHFHLMIYADDRTEQQLTHLPITKNILSEGIRLLLSSYTKGINKQENRTGNLIQQKTKSKCVYDVTINETSYATTCFNYIHQNPLRAGFVAKLDEWHYSSYRDYIGLRNGTLCSLPLAYKILGCGAENIMENRIFNDEPLKNIW